MKTYLTFLLVIGLSVIAQANGRIIDDADKLKKDQIVEATLDNLWPTQLAVGMLEVEEKEKKLNDMDHDDRLDYLKQHPVPVVVGPGGKLYVIDHHHLARALYETQHNKLYVQIADNWMQLIPTVFWQKMGTNNRVYLYDDMTKRTVSVDELPTRIEDMKDDPYRSLAGMLQSDGIIDKPTGNDIFFAQFRWSRFLVTCFEKIGFKYSNTQAWYKPALQHATECAQSPAAKSLPGYRGDN
jgi:hypothetical protein